MGMVKVKGFFGTGPGVDSPVCFKRKEPFGGSGTSLKSSGNSMDLSV